MSTHPTAAQTIASHIDDRFLASVVTRPETTITPVPVAALRPWQLLDVLWRGPSHPYRGLVAVEGERALLLSGAPERWADVADGARVESAEQAVELARLRTDPVLGMAKGGRLLSHVEDIRWLPHPSDEQRDRIAELQGQFADRIAPPSVVGTGPWTVSLWARIASDLQLLEVEVGRDGTMQVTTAVEARSLPVPVAL